MAFAKSIIDIILATKKTGNAPKEVAQDLSQATDAAGKNSEAAQRLNLAWKAAQASVTAAGVAFLKNVPAMVEQGNAINRSKDALVGYAGSANQAQLAIEAAQRATNFSITEFEAATNASRLYSMGLVDNAAEVEKLTKLATTLGGALGKEAGPALEEFSLLLANQSIQRLDTFGISSAEVRARMAELAVETGNTDREFLFMTATLEIAERQMNALSEAGFTATDNVSRLKAVARQAKEEFMGWLADGLMPVIDGLFGLADAVSGQEQAIFDSANTVEEYNAGIRALKGELGFLGIFIEELTETQFENAKLTAESNRLAEESALLAANEAAANQDLAASYEQINVSMSAVRAAINGRLGPAMAEYSENVATLEARNNLLKARLLELSGEGFDPLSEEVIGLTKEITANDQAILSETENLKKLTSEIIFNQIASQLNAEAALELGRALGLVDEQTYNTALAAENLAQQWDAQDGIIDGVISDTEGFAAAARDLRDGLLSIPTEVTTTVRVNEEKTVTTTVNQYQNTFQSTYSKYIPMQHGGTFTVDGTPGPDRVAVPLALTKDEEVTVTPRTGAKSGSGSGTEVRIGQVILNNELDMTVFTEQLKRI